jgi:outer membrane protein assembly factor BamB
MVYVGSGDDKVYGLNASTGALSWSYGTGNFIAHSSPAVANGVVYIGSYDGAVYALNAVNGAFLWSYNTGAAVDSSPAVVNGTVYVGSDDDNFYAFDLAGGTRAPARPNPAKLRPNLRLTVAR